MPTRMNIGQAAAAAGVSAKMIRHYEQIGLLPPAARTESGYRQYDAQDVSVLRFIRQSRQLGFPMQQIGELLGLWRHHGRSSRAVKALAQLHLQALAEQLRELAQMQTELTRLAQACLGDEQPHCAILDELSAHGRAAPAAPAIGTPQLRRAQTRTRGSAIGRPSDAGAPAGLMAWAHAIRGPGVQA